MQNVILSDRVADVVAHKSPATVGEQLAPVVRQRLEAAANDGTFGPLPGAKAGFYRAQVELALDGVHASQIRGVEFVDSATAAVGHSRVAAAIEAALAPQMKQAGFTEFKVFALTPEGQGYTVTIHVGGRDPNIPR